MSSGAMASGTVNAILLNEGYYTEHYQELKDLGYLPEGYTLPSGNTSKSEKTQPEAVATPEPVTTEKCTEKIMWATGTVNVRENGSTSYKKVGSLKAGEQVTVTGTDSTGWYEIQLQDGTVRHVSDKYLTEDEKTNDGLKTIILVSAVGLVVLGLGICTVTYLYRKNKK